MLKIRWGAEFCQLISASAMASSSLQQLSLNVSLFIKKSIFWLEFGNYYNVYVIKLTFVWVCVCQNGVCVCMCVLLLYI